MKYLLIFSVFLFCASVVLANDISQFVFTTNPQTIKPNEVSGKLTVQSQDAGGNGIPQTGCIAIETTSSTGEFSASSTNWILINRLTMSKGGKTRNFYYKDSSLGSYKIKAKIALRPDTIKTACTDWPIEQWNIQLIAEQDIIVSNTAESTTPEPIIPEPTSDVGSTTEQQTTTVVVWPTEPQIYANAGPDKIAVAGADVYFSGQALGLKKEPLDNARYLWNFGDGAIAEGQNTKHVYKYHGEYIAVLDVSSGKYSVSDRSMAKIIPNQLEIIEANENYIKLHNGSNVELDISSWFLRAENSLFKFPANTFIKTNRDLMIDSSISGLKAENQKAEILYPNSSVAFSYSGPIVTKSTKSTTVVDSSSIVKHSVLNKADNLQEEIVATSTNQTTSVITSTQNNSLGLKKWLMIILGMSIFFAGGFIFIRRQSSL